MNENHKQKVLLAKKLELLWSGVINPVLVGTVAAAFFIYYIKEEASSLNRYVWFSLIIFGSLVRLLGRYLFLNRRDTFTDPQWLNFYFWSTSFVATVWAVLTFFIQGNIPAEKEIVVICILLGMASGGAISSIADKRTALYYSNVIIIFFAIGHFIQFGMAGIYFLVAQALFILLTSRMIFSMNKILEESQRNALDLEGKLELEQQLKEEKIKNFQSAKLASLGEMAAGIAHEINNPLTISLGKLKILKKLLPTASDSKITSQIESLEEANKRIADIVYSMRNLSRVKDEAEFEDFYSLEVDKIINPIIFNKFKVNDIDYQIDIPQELMRADKGEIAQVAVNLLQNAVDAIEQADEKWIRVTGQIEQSFMVIRVMDSGPSISLAEQEKLFEPFYTTKEIGKGTGLGLSLSKSIMQRNKGDLFFEGKDGRTCFVMKIPLAK